MDVENDDEMEIDSDSDSDEEFEQEVNPLISKLFIVVFVT